MTSTSEPVPEVLDVDAATTAVVRGTVPIQELAGFFDSSFPAVGRALADQGVTVTGPAFGCYQGPPTDTAELEVGFTTDRPVRPEGTVEPSELPAGRVARVEHRGSFDGLGDTWQRLATWIADQGLTAGPVLWEVYVTEPSPDMDPAELRTELSWLLAD